VNKHLAFAIPGDIDSVTGGYAYDRHITQGLRALGWRVDLVPLGEGFPFPSPATTAETLRQLNSLPTGMPILIDGLASGCIPQILAPISQTHPIVTLLHHPLCMEYGLTLREQEHLRVCETASLQFARHLIVTSPSTANLLQDFGVHPKRISVVLPGVSCLRSSTVEVIQDSRNTLSPQPKATTELLSVGSLIPRKAQDLLVLALSQLTHLPWTLKIVGDLNRNPAYTRRVLELIDTHRLQNRVHLTGVLGDEALHNLFLNADVFVLPSLFEGYGMAFAEAMSYGLPIIGSTGGAVSQTVPPSAGVLVAPNDLPALKNALQSVLLDHKLRAHYAAGSAQEAKQLPSWASSCAQFAQALHSCLA